MKNTTRVTLLLLATAGAAFAQERVETPTALAPWSGSWVSGWSFGTEAMQPAFDAIMGATPELTQADILAYYERGNRTDFDAMRVEGQQVTFEGDGGSVTCAYGAAGTEDVAQVPGQAWSLFETTDEACAPYRYLLLNPQHAAEPGSSPHFHMRYGDSSFTALAGDDGPWFPSLYPEGTEIDAVTGGWSASARTVGVYIADVLGKEVAATEVVAQVDAEDAEDSEHDHEHAAGTRLLVSDAEANVVKVLDLATGEALASFSTPGAGGSVYASPSGQYGLVIHRDENRVSVVHSGLSLEDHGDHADLVQGAPHVLHTLNVGREPTHYWAHGDEIVIFNDADGTVALLNERSFGLSLEYTSVTTAQPDHGAAVVLGDTVLAGYYELGRVDAYNREGELLETIEGCPGLHGEATLGDVAAFGCEDGALLVHVHDGDVSATKLDNPDGTADEVRVGTLTAHDAAAVLVGNFGDGLAWIDPDAETMNVIDTGATPLRFAFDHEGEHLLALTEDGMLHRLEADTGEVHGSVRVMQAVDTSGGHGSYVTPGLAVAEGAVYISVPTEGQVAEVHLDDLTVARRLEVSGTPSGVAVMALEGGTTH